MKALCHGRLQFLCNKLFLIDTNTSKNCHNSEFFKVFKDLITHIVVQLLLLRYVHNNLLSNVNISVLQFCNHLLYLNRSIKTCVFWILTPFWYIWDHIFNIFYAVNLKFYNLDFVLSFSKVPLRVQYVVLFILPNPPFLLYFLSKMILSIGFLYKIGPM